MIQRYKIIEDEMDSRLVMVDMPLSPKDTRHQRDMCKSEDVAELEAQVPVVGTFVWALMQNWTDVEANLFGTYETLNEYRLYNVGLHQMVECKTWRLK